jgi:hypothetical protein
MPDIEAARIVYGTPSDADSQMKLEDWMDTHCRDWRYESGALQGVGHWCPIVISAVFNDPMDKGKLTNLVTQQARRWRFTRAKHSTDNIREMSIDSYADGPLGAKMTLQVQIIMADIATRNEVQKQQKAAERRARMEKFAKALAAVKQRAVDRKLKAAMDKLRKNVDEAHGLLDAALEQEFKRRRVEEDR